MFTPIQWLTFLQNWLIWSDKRNWSSIKPPRNLVWEILGRFCLLILMTGTKSFFMLVKNRKKTFGNIIRDNLFAHNHSSTFLQFEIYFVCKYRNISSEIVGSAVISVVDQFQIRTLVYVIDIQNKEKEPQNWSLGHSVVYLTFRVYQIRFFYIL